MAKPARAVLLDTNILLWLTNPNSDLHMICRDAVQRLQGGGCQLYFTLQNAAEFWNVSTRPVDRNGFGLSTGATEQRLESIENNLVLLADDVRVYTEWRQLVKTCAVRGMQVHDARLAAAMRVHGIPQILTYNGKDFSRYRRVQVLSPTEVTAE